MFDFIEDEVVRTQAEEAANTAINEKVKEVEASFSQKIEVEIQKATKRLKSKNAELLDEKKKIQDTLKNFENIDPDKAKEALQFLDENEYAQMVKDGRIEELLDKRTSKLKSEHEEVVQSLGEQLKELSGKASTYEEKYNRRTINEELRKAAAKAGVREEAITDILLRGSNVFSVADDESLESRDEEGNLKKTEDGKILTPENWIEELKNTSPHYWPASAGAGAIGSSVSGNALDTAIRRAAEAGNMNEYRRLREQQEKSKA
jgi:hypothetical protein